ncbi:MAG: tetratricopeptide repeat protein [Acidobacteriota bacterium]
MARAVSNLIQITPELTSEQAEALTKSANQFDKLLEGQDGRPVQAVRQAALEQLGGWLWQASGLDADELIEALDDARAEQVPLRLEVIGAEHQQLPWELLFHGDEQLGFVARNPWCVLMRRPKGKGKEAPAAAARPLRVLLFVASPEDLDPEKSRLDFEREEEQLFTALDGSMRKGEVELDVAEDGLLSTLVRRLSEDRYHAVLLSLHGSPARNAKGQEEWGLLFEDEETGLSRSVAGSDLAAELDELPPGHRPRLTILSACRSAKAEDSAAPISSVARTLHQAGFERVVGMRLSVLDVAASAFTAALLPRLAQGNGVGRSVSLARAELATGKWLGQEISTSKGASEGDAFAQWSLPVLFDRTTGGPLIDPALPAELVERPPLANVLIGTGALELPTRGSFIGRRAVMRRHLRSFLDGSRPRLLFTGPGGVGKTTLAAQFGSRLRERVPDVRLLGFRAPFELADLYEPLREEAFDGEEEAGLQDALNAAADQREGVRRLLQSLSQREEPLALLLDNLESVQALEDLEVSDEHVDSLWFLETACSLAGSTRVLLTGRYALEQLEGLVLHSPIGDAPAGDVLRRMSRLGWPEGLKDEDKHHLRRLLGGNHRALEWASQVLETSPRRAPELLKAVQAAEAPPGTAEEAAEVVLEALRQNLLFKEVRALLGTEAETTLQRAALYRVPFTEDGLRAVAPNREQQDETLRRLLDYSLLERAEHPILKLTYHSVSPVVRELLGSMPMPEKARRRLHGAMGRYHRFQGAEVSRLWSDDTEAIAHFRMAEEHAPADDLAEAVAGFRYSRGDFAGASRLTEEIVARSVSPVPWWAWNRHGMCMASLGRPEEATMAHVNALAMARKAGDRVSEGTSLNNLSQVHGGRGGLDESLGYLKQSLRIRREVGDRGGEGVTLNNMSKIYMVRGELDEALSHLKQSLEILREVGDRAGEGTTLNNIASVHQARGEYDEALGHLKQSLEIVRAVGDRAGEGASISNIASVHQARGELDEAIVYSKQSLEILREIGDRAGEGTNLNNISQIYFARGELAEALDFMKQSLEIRREVGDRVGEGTTLNNIASVHHARGELDEALEYLQQSLEIRREVGDRAGEGATLNNISQVHDARGELNEALRYLRRGLETLREVGDRAGEGATLNNIASIHQARGELDEALDYMKQSLEILREVGDRAGAIPTLHNMAMLSIQRGSAEQAIPLWIEALQNAQATGNAQGIFEVSRALGRVLAQAGAAKEARHLLARALLVGQKLGRSECADIEQQLISLGPPEDSDEVPE